MDVSVEVRKQSKFCSKISPADRLQKDVDSAAARGLENRARPIPGSHFVEGFDRRPQNQFPQEPESRKYNRGQTLVKYG
jgi:hypothetical protein